MKVTYFTISGLVALVFSWGLFVPADLKEFNLLAVIGTMAGIAVANRWEPSLRSRIARTAVIVIDVALCFASTMAYVFLIQAGSANRTDLVVLGALLMCVFFTFAALFPLAGVKPDKIPGGTSRPPQE